MNRYIAYFCNTDFDTTKVYIDAESIESAKKQVIEKLNKMTPSSIEFIKLMGYKFDGYGIQRVIIIAAYNNSKNIWIDFIKENVII